MVSDINGIFKVVLDLQRVKVTTNLKRGSEFKVKVLHNQVTKLRALDNFATFMASVPRSYDYVLIMVLLKIRTYFQFLTKVHLQWTVGLLYNYHKKKSHNIRSIIWPTYFMTVMTCGHNGQTPLQSYAENYLYWLPISIMVIIHVYILLVWLLLF